MTNRERALAVLDYEEYDRLPIVHFGFWRTRDSVLYRWADEGHISRELAENWADGNEWDRAITEKLGFDINWNVLFHLEVSLLPPLETGVIEELPDGSRKVMNSHGAIVLEKNDAGSIPMSFDHLLKGRKEWEEIFLPRLQFADERINGVKVHTPDGVRRFDKGGRECLLRNEWDYPYGIRCGSLYGSIRNWLGLEGSAYLQVDDEALFDEIIDTVGSLCYRTTKAALETGVRFDFAHFWEDIAFKTGPLINPEVFQRKIGPHYRRITTLLGEHGIHNVSLDCDGLIDALIPTWIENGVNTMFPIEVGTWHASIEPWRRQYGRRLKGVGGMEKRLFGYDRATIDAEIERLKALVDLGGFLPCPDHRIAPDAEWDNVRYYCDRMRHTFR